MSGLQSNLVWDMLRICCTIRAAWQQIFRLFFVAGCPQWAESMQETAACMSTGQHKASKLYTVDSKCKPGALNLYSHPDGSDSAFMLSPIMWHAAAIRTLNEFSAVAAQQATSKCSSALVESSWIRHQTCYHCNFAADEKDRIFLSAWYLEKVFPNQGFDMVLGAK